MQLMYDENNKNNEICNPGVKDDKSFSMSSINDNDRDITMKIRSNDSQNMSKTLDNDLYNPQDEKSELHLERGQDDVPFNGKRQAVKLLNPCQNKKSKRLKLNLPDY